ncbi:MAG: phthalate 4,5-dioxygenase [Chloroflexi bacterium]|nr:phthalate 4,5-dioxygenase [Chloroflexota bacterium]
MLTSNENDLLTRTGPGDPGGELLRRYWQPVALAEELPTGGAPLPVKLLGEDLVLFRDERGRPGLLGIHCAHRGADLSYGRLEDGGIRCIYHGWLYDRTGRCLEQPGEPAGSTFHQRIRQTAYSCVEAGGLILAYLGPGEAPLLPDYEFFTAPSEYVAPTKALVACNYLQANEGNFDPVHLSFLHRRIESDDDLHVKDVTPTIDVEETAFGARVYAIRRVAVDSNFVKVRAFIMPNLGAAAGDGGGGYQVNWHVPIDDTSHWRYMILFRRTTPFDEGDRRSFRNGVNADYKQSRNRGNRYLQDRAEMKLGTYTGMGAEFLTHDTAATEGEGLIQDRTQEHLGYTDRAIVALRQMLLSAVRDVQEGRDPPHVVRDPAANHFADIEVTQGLVPSSDSWRGFWKRDFASVGRSGAVPTRSTS